MFWRTIARVRRAVRARSSTPEGRPLTMTDHRSDGVHFNGAGYDRWAAAVTSSILNPPTRALGTGRGAALRRVPKAAVISATVGASALLIVLALRLRGKI